MKIAVVGGGIFGVTAALTLSKNFDVTLFEKSNEILKAASGSNQYRVHRGYHYPRSKDTVLGIKKSENSFKKIVDFFGKHPDFSILGTGIVDENNQPYPVRLWEDSPQEAALKILGIYNPANELKKMEPMLAKEAKVISGCCFVVTRSLIECIGLMDENYFLYNEEDDLCRRARKAGKRICFYPDTSVQHLQGQSTHQKRYRKKVIIEAYRSNIYFYSKYYSFIWNIILRSLYKMTFFLTLLRSILRHFRGSATIDDSLSLKLKLLLMSPKKKKV